jgi:ABC-2 type transport system ATP-binding protein
MVLHMNSANPDVITVSHLAKHYGDVVAVDDVSFSVRPGTVVGYLGPNGSGKTTTLRALLGLVEPTAGTAGFSGTRYRDLPRPARVVGALLDGMSSHPARTAHGHLVVLASAIGDLHRSRVDEVLDHVGLTDAAHRRVGGFSQGMRQRLGLAGALLGDPQILLLDEPSNGLDPEGIRWLRTTLRAFAAGGGTVLISSHVLAEVEQTVDEVVIINAGRVVTHRLMADLTSDAERTASVRIRTPDQSALTDALDARRHHYDVLERGVVRVYGVPSDDLGVLAALNGVVIYEMTAETNDLESTFFALTARENAR